MHIRMAGNFHHEKFESRGTDDVGEDHLVPSIVVEPAEGFFENSAIETHLAGDSWRLR